MLRLHCQIIFPLNICAPFERVLWMQANCLAVGDAFCVLKVPICLIVLGPLLEDFLMAALHTHIQNSFWSQPVFWQLVQHWTQYAKKKFICSLFVCLLIIVLLIINSLFSSFLNMPFTVTNNEVLFSKSRPSC